MFDPICILYLIPILIPVICIIIIKKTTGHPAKKTIWLVTIILGLLIISYPVYWILGNILFRPSIIEGEIEVEFQQGVSLDEIQNTLDEYGYEIIVSSYADQKDYYLVRIKVPVGKERDAVKNLEKEEIVADARVLPYE